MGLRAWGCLFACASALASATTGCTPGPDEIFANDVAPMLEQRCATAACHGVARGERWPDDEGLFFRLDDDGRLADLEAARRISRERIVTEAPPLLSSLVRTPLPGWASGGPHAGGAVLVGPDDPATRALVRWIEAEPDGSGGEDLELDELEIAFRDDVLPVLVRRCGFAGCHGPTELAFSPLTARPDPETGRFAPRDVRKTRELVRKHIDLQGDDPRRSRLVRKAIGEDSGGLVHRGGFGTFFSDAPPDAPFDSPEMAPILEWIRRERGAVGITDGRAPSALLYVRGPPEARSPWRIAPGAVGSDLWMAPWPIGSGPSENLTASLHLEGDAEVRDPAISHDARTVAFAMRRAVEDRFSLWRIDLETRDAKRLTRDSDPGSFVQPTFAPDGRIVAAWDGHGGASADGDGVAPDLVIVAPDGSFEQLTWTPAPEVAPVFLSTGKTRGTLLFATRREGPLGGEAVLFRFPLCHDPDHHGEPEYHVQFGASIAPLAPHTARDLLDGRQIVVVLPSTGATDDRGTLALLDRSLGPAVPAARAAQTSVGGFRQPITMLDPGTGATYRDPAPLPDGRVLVSDDAIHVVTIADAFGGPSAGAIQELLRVPGESLRSPTPVIARAPEDMHLPIVDPSSASAYLAFRDVAVLEALYGRAAPLGERSLLAEIKGLRLLTWGNARASGFRRHADGGTTVGLTTRAPARLLGEIELPADRSAWLRIPARTPVLLQLLDERGMVIGNQLDRWYFGEGEEVVPGGTNVDTYAHDCSGCHGSTSGRPEAAVAPPPDAISAASVTLARYEDRDRRRPLPPTDLGGAPIAIDWVRTIAPAFGASCASTTCHGGAAPAGGIALDRRPGTGRFDAGYEAVVARAVDRDGLRARRSVLVERLLGEELEAAPPVTGECPPGGASDALVRDVVRWIESGAFYDVEREEPIGAR